MKITLSSPSLHHLMWLYLSMAMTTLEGFLYKWPQDLQALEAIEFGERSGRMSMQHGNGNKAWMIPFKTIVQQARTKIYSQPTIEQLSTRVEQLRQNAYRN